MARRDSGPVASDVSGRLATVRYVALLAAVALTVAGCSSGESEDMDVSIDITSYPATQQSEWVATGPAVEEGVICGEATLSSERFEYADGLELSVAELGIRNDGTEPFSWVAVGEYGCVDGSGSFTMRLLNEAENPAAFVFTATWTLKGGDGYEGVSGEGDNHGITIEGEPVVMRGTNSGEVRGG